MLSVMDGYEVFGPRSVFLDYRADVNLQSSDGQTALHKALETDHVESESSS